MRGQTAGFQWLKEHLNLQYFNLTHVSIIGSRNKIEIGIDNVVEETFGAKYAPVEDDMLPHIEFGLKYDDLVKHIKMSPYRDMISFCTPKPVNKTTGETNVLKL